MKQVKKRKQSLLDTFETTYNLTHNAKVTTYIQTYIDCEVSAQKLIRYYKKDIGRKAPARLYLPNILKTVDHFGLKVDRSLIFRIFPGGEGLRNKKSPRQLRNAYVHKKHPQDCLEMLATFDRHLAWMRVWLDAIESYAKNLINPD